MGNLKQVSSLGMLALGLGVGAALAATPIAGAGTLAADGGAGALGVAGALAAADLGDAVATVGTAAATAPTLPDDFGNIALSISGFDLLSLGNANASSSFGNIAFAYGEFANANANAMSGFFNYASAQGDHSNAVVGDTGSFNYASALGDHASASAAWGNGNVATATGDYAVAHAGASVVPGVYDSHFNTATAEGLHAIAYAGWDGSSNNVASALGDDIQDYTPDGNPFNPADADLNLLGDAGSGGDFWTDLWGLFS